MKAIAIRKPRLVLAASLIGIVALERAIAWMTGSEGGWGGLGGGLGLLAFGLGHCDGVDGPVVTLARRALDAGNVNLVLPWVREHDEAEIREAFAHAVAVRKLGGEAKDLADRHFFETLVRVHRAGEGAPYTGLKPAGRDLGPAIPAADRALQDGSIDKVLNVLSDALRKGLEEHYHHAVERKDFAPDDVKAGRDYVEAYVPYIHYVERLWQAASGTAHGHHAADEAHTHH
ncbi:MAG TPA: DUF6448 family protein [Burkholderiales bacterium]